MPPNDEDTYPALERHHRYRRQLGRDMVAVNMAPGDLATSVTVFVATVALGDDRNDPVDEIVGVFTTRAAALEAAMRAGPHTADVDAFTLDVPADWSQS